MSSASHETQATEVALAVSEQLKAVFPVRSLCSVFAMSISSFPPDFRTDGSENAKVKFVG
ncbi:MAG: hypothetical protein IPK55_12110 [Streptococcus sp.]|nr:hypothetical protein [Streptococcus sp.]